MRKFLWLTAFLVSVFLPARAWCRQSDTKTDPQQEQQQVHGAQGQQSAAAAGADSQDHNKNSSAQNSAGGSDLALTSAAPQDSLAAAARKAREQKKESAKAAKVFTNDNIPTTGGVSSIGSDNAKTPDDNAAGAAPADKDEKGWRDKFAQLHHKLDQDKQDLDVMQRELGVLDVQYYNDPVKAMQEQYSRDDINKKTAAIEAKKKAIDADQQAIDDAEDDLRKAGGDPGWAR